MSIRHFILGCFLSVTLLTSAYADENLGTAVIFKDDSGAQLTIVRYGENQENTYLVKFEKFHHDWDNKIILHHFVDSATNKKYEIRVETGKKLRPIKTFVTVVDSGRKTLVKGSIVSVVEVYLKGQSNPHYLVQAGQDSALAKSLLAQYKQQQFYVDF